jgi:hypothetical protein
MEKRGKEQILSCCEKIKVRNCQWTAELDLVGGWMRQVGWVGPWKRVKK